MQQDLLLRPLLGRDATIKTYLQRTLLGRDATIKIYIIVPNHDTDDRDENLLRLNTILQEQ